MIIEGLKYPLILQNEENLWRKLIIGGVLVTLTPLILPAILYLGYIHTLVESINNNSKKLPGFTDYTTLMRKGSKLTIVVIIYTVPLSIATLLAISLQGILQLIAACIIALLYITIFHLTPIILHTSIFNKDLKPALDIPEMLQKSMEKQYIYITIVMSFIYPVIFGIIQGIAILTLVGIIFIPLILMWQTISFSYLIAQLSILTKT